jgi:uncharacterized protein with ATP-grasp and redox domains
VKSQPDCIACMFKQALNTTREVTDDPDVILKVMRRVADTIDKVDLGRTPALNSQNVYNIVSDVTGIADPFADQKRESNSLALRVLPHIRDAVLQSDDPLAAGVHLAAVGNMIDAGIGHAAQVDIEADIMRMLDYPFGIFDLEDFSHELGPGKQLLYLGDNAGEIIFDTVLVDLIRNTGTQVTFAVKSAPIINDATLEDAATADMASRARVIETGSNDIGVNFANVSDEFRSAFELADVILGKGHGNFETCSERPENLYFLLKAKCDIVAAELGVNLGDLVFKHNPAPL